MQFLRSLVIGLMITRVRAWLVLAPVICVACGSDSPARPSPNPNPNPNPTPSQFTVASVTDGDTLRFSPPLSGSTALRMLNIDAPETAQAPWGAVARTGLQQLATSGTEISIETDRTILDTFDRVLGHAVRRDGMNLNREQLRQGHAVLYVIWPNMSRFEEYRAAQIEAQDRGRGVWDPGAPLAELPYEYRLRIDGQAPFRPAGDFYTGMFVEPPDYGRVHVNNRVFFNTRADASAAQYQPCPRDSAGRYEASCFASGR
jgi:endonuclease YncB( thermonuclease family)